MDEEGNVRDSASDNLRSARSSCISIERRLRNALAKLPGDVTVHAGRLCVAVPDGSGLLLGLRCACVQLFLDGTVEMAKLCLAVCSR